MLQRDRQYFKNILNILKEIAFHQIYMESARKDLCKDEHYDPHTAFKSMDHFKHNRVIPYELYSYFQLYSIEATTEECEHIIQSLNKSLSYMDYESFEELTLPATDQTLKNLSKTRYNNVQIGIGSYSKLSFVKEHSGHCIALFLQKQLNFLRQFIFLKQDFCRKWGGDIYTLLQKLFPRKDNKQNVVINFEDLLHVGRQYGILFNESEYRCIWRRSKKDRENLEEMAGKISISFDQVHSLLLVSNLKTKGNYGLELNVPLKQALSKPKPSYQTSHWREHEQWQQNEKKMELQKLNERREPQRYKMKFPLSYPESMQDPYYLKSQLRQKNNSWCEMVDKMSQNELIQAYLKITTRSSLFSNQK